MESELLTHKFHHRGYTLITNCRVHALTVIFLFFFFKLLVVYAVPEKVWQEVGKEAREHEGVQ